MTTKRTPRTADPYGIAAIRAETAALRRTRERLDAEEQNALDAAHLNDSTELVTEDGRLTLEGVAHLLGEDV